MDLLTSIANEFDIPIIRKDQRVWFFRTRGGKYYKELLFLKQTHAFDNKENFECFPLYLR